MSDQEFARQFATEWIEAWNRHDPDRVLAHYADEFQMSSPLIAAIAEVPSGTLKGKQAVRAYWAEGPQLLPDLRFELRSILVGVESRMLAYQGHRSPVAEVFHFSPDWKDVRAMVHDSLSV